MVQPLSKTTLNKLHTEFNIHFKQPHTQVAHLNIQPQVISLSNYNEYLEKILQKINELFLVPAPPSQPQLDPRAQGHKRKIIAYDDL